MGKRRSNHNKKKKNGKNLIQNSYDKTSPVTNQDEKNEEDSKNCSSVRAKELSHVQQSKHNASSSYKETTKIHESSQNITVSNLTEKDESLTTEIINMQLHRNVHKNNSLHNYKMNSTSDFPVKRSTVTGILKPNSGSQIYPIERDNRLLFVENVIDESSEDEEEYSTSDFFKPVFDDCYKSKNNKMLLDKKFHKPADKSSLWAENTFASEASCSGYRNSEKPAFNGKIIKDTISCSVDSYKNSKDYFLDVYQTWLPQRKSTLQKLEGLKEEVRNSQLNYNKSQETFREASLMSRMGKNPDNQVVDFFASLSAFLSDTASGIVSVVQAFNVDSYQDKFKEIMEHDAEITQQLYRARSQCVAKYHDIEEVMTKFHSDNLSSTVGKISNSLEVGKYWEGMKKAYENNNMPQLLDVVSKFFDNACQPTKLQEVSDSIERYVDDNPASLDAVKFAGRATYGAIDTFKLNHSQNRVLKGVDLTANHLLMIDDREHIQRLRSTMEEDSPQSKIESEIAEAIDHLECELREIKNTYFELSKSHFDSDSERDFYGYY